ncbi:MAG: acyl-ACP thioesterase domain-containing protein [Ilumatobacteraceae bacterium]
MFEFASAPTSPGRVFEGAAVVRLGDSSPGGRARLDAIARHLQDISDDDARAAGFGDYTWVVRRTAIAVHVFPTYVEPLQLRTWCSGFGAAWAERRITMAGERGGHVESATLWVHLDAASMRPARMPAEFLDVFGPSAGGRKVGSKAVLAPAPADAFEHGTPWPLRFADFDVLEHVNNAVYWAAVEQELAARRELRAPFTAVIEHGDAIERDDAVRWFARSAGDGFEGWLVGEGGRVFAAARVSAGV